MKYHFFWKSKIAQWNIKEFKDKDGFKYCCVEQYMMAQKAILFNDIISYMKIMKSNSPKEHQEFGRKIKNFNEKIWDINKEIIVFEGNFFKFSQNKDLFDLLLETNDKILVEASPYDLIWGVGLSKDNPLILDEKNWRGQNLLGNILTLVRDYLKKYHY